MPSTRTLARRLLDVRGNQGGHVTALQTLLGGLSSSDVKIGETKERDRVTPLVAKGTVADAFTGRVFVLIDAKSASASELLARVIQLTERGTVIGDRSAGAVMTSRFHPLVVSHGENVISFGVMVTAADPIMSDGGRLEKKVWNPTSRLFQQRKILPVEVTLFLHGHSNSQGRPLMRRPLARSWRSPDGELSQTQLLRQAPPATVVQRCWGLFTCPNPF